MSDSNIEPIEMLERRHGYFPKTFIWRGQQYDVYAVERCWATLQWGWTRREKGGKHRFRVRCSFDSAQDRHEGTFEVYQDIHHNAWHLQLKI